jgi:hypothetical protein
MPLSLAEARALQKDLVLDIDVQGARQLKAKIPEAVTYLSWLLRARFWSKGSACGAKIAKM